MATLFVMMGLPASGKSYFAEELIKKNPGAINVLKIDWHNANKIRLEELKLSDKKEDYEKTFVIMKERTLESLRNNRNVIYDARNLYTEKREKLLEDVRKELPDTYIIGIFIDCEPKDCEKRNELRKGSKYYVPNHEIWKAYNRCYGMYDDFSPLQRPGKWLLSEEMDKLIIVNNNIPHRLVSHSKSISACTNQLSEDYDCTVKLTDYTAINNVIFKHEANQSFTARDIVEKLKQRGRELKEKDVSQFLSWDVGCCLNQSEDGIFSIIEK